MNLQGAFFGDVSKNKWVIFHDESFCKEEKFLYHGFLLVRSEWGASIWKTLLDPFSSGSGCSHKYIHFTELSNLNSERSKIAIQWLQQALRWLAKDQIKYYCFGVNLDNINYNLFNSDAEKKIYKKFYEVGLKASLRWFKISPDKITHVYYDQGKQDVDRYYKTLSVCGRATNITPLFNRCDNANGCLCKFLQLTDVILGSIRKNLGNSIPKRAAQKKCADLFYDIVDFYSDSKTAYNLYSQYYKKFCLSFFPKYNKISVREFLEKDTNYYLKTRDIYYCERLTYLEKIGRSQQMSLL